MKNLVLDDEKRDAFDRPDGKLSLKKQKYSDQCDPFEKQSQMNGKQENVKKNYQLDKKIKKADDIEEYNPFAKIQKPDEIIPKQTSIGSHRRKLS